jgi:hypothetical protein
MTHMNESDHDFAKWLRRHMSPVEQEEPRDLWPLMRARLDSSRVRWSWFDAILAAFAAAACMLAPRAMMLVFASL